MIHMVDPCLLSQLESHDVASIICQARRTDNARNFIIHIVDPRLLSQLKSHDVASIICQAVPC